VEEHLKARYRPVADVSDDERIGIVIEVFSTVTGRYDFLNHFLSLRRDIAWRSFAVRKMRFFQTFRLLDVATGTGDLAILAVRRHPGIRAAGLDFVQAMMDVASVKIVEKGLPDRIRLLRGDALALPFPENHFDVAAIAFGIRNIPKKTRALEEMRRVVVPGGQVMVLETVAPRGPFCGKLYQLYLNRILPQIARFFSQNPAAYHYLADSIMHFPPPPVFAGQMERAGLKKIQRYALDFGIASLFVGIKDLE
jgi:demethylmenaquinone methyltransferase/2-methoxy-6-polyprenyl-1,4-benzoquinol methylase